jgi:hypothetical protein
MGHRCGGKLLTIRELPFAPDTIPLRCLAGSEAVGRFRGVPLSGQGKPLPSDFGYEGEWIHEDRMFLYRPAAQTSLDGCEIMPFVRNADGTFCFGVNSMELAFELRVSGADIFIHNRAGTLYLVCSEDVPPTGGALAAKRYIFEIEGVQVPLTIEAGAPSGSA